MYSRLVPQTPEKIAGQIAGQIAFEGGEVLISSGKLVPPARFQRATFRLGVSARVFTWMISVHHKSLNQPIFID